MRKCWQETAEEVENTKREANWGRMRRKMARNRGWEKKAELMRYNYQAKH